MAYYNNPYYGYYSPMMPMIYPQQQQVVEQPQQQTNNAMDSLMVWVQGKAGAQSYPVARGTTLPLFDSEGDYLYIKSVDNNGIPMPLVTKVLSDPPTETKEKEVETSSQVTPKVDMSDYVTKKSYDELKKKYSELESRILDLETKPTSSFTSTFTGNTFNNTKKEGGKNESKFTL
jgi:hypothetical protein